jgi:cytoskeleton-associated protein 5
MPMNNLKTQRINDEAKLRVLKWNFSVPRDEFVEQLKEQMNTAGVNKSLMTNMFHADFKFHLKAIDSLGDVRKYFKTSAFKFCFVVKLMTSFFSKGFGRQFGIPEGKFGSYFKVDDTALL